MWLVVDGTRRGTSAGREGGWYHRTAGRPARRGGRPASRLTPVVAIIGGLGAAVLWAAATLCSSRSSRMLGSRVVLGWVMVVGVVVGLPIAAVSPGPETLEPSTLGLLGLAGICYVIGLQLTYAALRIGKVSIVAPIVATEGAVAALIAVALGDPLGVVGGLMPRRRRRAASSCRRSNPAGRRCRGRRFRRRRRRASTDRPRSTRLATAPAATRRASGRHRRAALLVDRRGAAPSASVWSLPGQPAALVPVAWVALSRADRGHRGRGRHPARHAADACG